MSTKRRAESKHALNESLEEASASVEQVRRKIHEGYYDRPEVRRIIATLFLRRTARKHPRGNPPETA